jgi:hypothetical protein
VLRAVQSGAAYTPLTQQAVDSITHVGGAPADWQPFAPLPALLLEASGLQSSLKGAAGSSSSAHAAAVAADARLQLALERLCGCSGITLAAACATARDCSQAPAVAAVDSPGLSRASSASYQCLSATGSDGSSVAAMPTAVAVVTAEDGCGSNGGGSSKEPVWLYINHLGWCRCGEGGGLCD